MAAKILIVEADPDCLDVLRLIISHSGRFEIVDAQLGREAIELARRECPDLIVLDLSLPDLTGFEVMEMLRKDQTTDRIPIVVYTSWAHETFKSKSIKAGASAFVAKPASRAVLRKTIIEVLAEYKWSPTKRYDSL